MEQLKILSKKTLLKTSQSLDDIPILIKGHLKKSKAKSSTLGYNKDERKLNKDNKESNCKYEIIATSVVDDNEEQSDSNDDSNNNFKEIPCDIKKLQKNNNKQNSEPNLNSNYLYNLDNNIIDKKNIIENNEKKEENLIKNSESNINEIPIKCYLTDNNSSGNTPTSKNISFSTHYKNSSECSNNGKGLGDNGDNSRFMEDDNNYKDDNNNIYKKKSKESQVIIEEISVDKFFEYLNLSNISKINENHLELNINSIYNILIFDFRLHDDFENEYISKSINVNIPKMILNRSLKHNYKNSFNIQKFVNEKDKIEIEKWILNNYKINQNKNLNIIPKPLIIVYDDQNIMDIDISNSPVKTFIKYLEVQHIIALNELNYSLLTEQSDSSSISQSTSQENNKEYNISDYLLDKQLNIAWVTGGYDAICNNSESSNYILNNEINNNCKKNSPKSNEDVCFTPLELHSSLNISNDISTNMECSTPIDSKPINFNSDINNNNVKNFNNNKPNFHLDILNKKSKNQKQKLSLNINCAINNSSDECKTPLSAIPNGKENIVNPNYSLDKGIQLKKYNNSLCSTPLLDDDDKPKNIRRKVSVLSLKTDVGKIDNKLRLQMQPNGMLGVDKKDYNQSKGSNNSSPKLIDKNFLRVSSCSPSSDLPLNISPTTSTVIPHYTQVLPYLYIGTETIPASPNAIERLKKLKVTHVLNVAMECNVGVTFPEDQIVYKKIDLADNLSENIAKYLWESCEWIENERKKNNNAVFYIHCKAGKSRSATVVIAYLMKSEHWSMNEAYNYLKDLRPNISPNLGFVSALMEMEAEIKQQESNN